MNSIGNSQQMIIFPIRTRKLSAAERYAAGYMDGGVSFTLPMRLGYDRIIATLPLLCGTLSQQEQEQ